MLRPITVALLMGLSLALEDSIIYFNMSQRAPLRMIGHTFSDKTLITVKVECDSTSKQVYQVRWLLRPSPCLQEYFESMSSGNNSNGAPTIQDYVDRPWAVGTLPSKEAWPKGFNVLHGSVPEFSCSDKGGIHYFPGTGSQLEHHKWGDQTVLYWNINDETALKVDKNAPWANTTACGATWKTGIYAFIIEVMTKPPLLDGDWSLQFTVNMSAPHGYLSATDYPLLVFYGSMCAVYAIYGLIWLLYLACYWRDLLKLQFWIGGVILLGLLEKAVFCASYDSLNRQGLTPMRLLVSAEIVSAFKRALARMLVIIVSVGFGIVRPVLGTTLHKIVGLGALFFVLASFEGVVRILMPSVESRQIALLADIPLAVIDAFACWWIFTSLVVIIKQLRLRRNLVKLALYRHFMNSLIFAVLASICFMTWSAMQYKFPACISNIQEYWIDQAGWHVLFSILLFIIMILFRPSMNKQRFAFSPTFDEDSEAEEPMLDAEAYNMTRRDGRESTGSTKPAKRQKDIEDELKWIDENIPPSIADKAQAALLMDSDEEVMTTRQVLSKTN